MLQFNPWTAEYFHHSFDTMAGLGGLSASECPVCFEELGEDRQPYSLSCGHTLCRVCVHSLLKRGTAEFSCPLCRIRVQKTSVKLNVTLYHLLMQLRATSLLHSPQTLDINFEDLQLGKMLDRGAFGEVYRAKWRDNEVAVKVFSAGQLSPEAQDAFKREVFVMNCLRHPNVVLLMAACHTPPHLAIVMEFLAGGSLYLLLHIQKHRPEIKDIVSLAGDICRGLQYLHSINILHRDLKSKNVLLTGMLPCQAKLCDFGMARMRVESATMTGNVGTIHWTAPEVLNCSRYRFSADVYSFGMVLYELVTGNIPFGSLPPAVVIVSVLMKREQPKVIEDTHPLLTELIRGCTKWEPKERPSIPTILTNLSSLLPQPPEEEHQQQQEGLHLSHTDSLGHVFLSIGEDDVDILELLQAKEEEGFPDSVGNASDAGDVSGLVSQSELDQFFQQTEVEKEEKEEEEEEKYFPDKSDLSVDNVPPAKAAVKLSRPTPYMGPYPSPPPHHPPPHHPPPHHPPPHHPPPHHPPLHHPPLHPPPHLPLPPRSPPKKTKSAISKKAAVPFPSKQKMRPHQGTVPQPQHYKDDFELAKSLMEEEMNQQELADYHLAFQMQNEENVIRVPTSQRPNRHHLRGASIPRPPPLPPIAHSTHPQLLSLTPRKLVLSQVKNATSRLTKKKLKPVKTVEKRAFRIGRVVDGTDGERLSHSVNREIESFSKRWLQHVPFPQPKPAALVGRVLPYGISTYKQIKFKKEWLHHSETEVHNHLPTKKDIVEERVLSAGVPPEVRPALWRPNSEVHQFDQSLLYPVETTVHNTLPTQQDILEEKQNQSPDN